MHYDLYVNDNLILSGSLIAVFIVTILALFILWAIGHFLWKKLRAYEDLKYEFVTIIAHKFRTPLTQTKWILETLLQSEQDSFKKESMSNMSESNEKLINLTNTLVELTDSTNQKLAAYNFERVNLCEVTDKVLNSLKDHFHEKNIFFGIQYSASEIYVKMDRPRMEFVIQTILENSINYSFTGRNVDVTVAVDKGKAVVQVVDNGIGIDPSEMPRIFSKFYRSHSAQTMDTEGFGVGLFLAQSIVKRHGGKIQAVSEGLNKGTAFIITLPLIK